MMADKATKRCWETCRHDLGGGYNNCRINLEAECADGGFEAWESKFTEPMVSFCISVKKFAHGIKKITQAIEKLAKAMKKARGLYRPKFPRKIQIMRAKAMMKKRERSRIWRDEP